jgi:hypothetical protein
MRLAGRFERAREEVSVVSDKKQQSWKLGTVVI